MNLFFSKNALLAGLCTVVLSGYSSSLYAGNSTSPEPTAVQQTKKITGTVSDAMGPVIGASVVIKGTSNGIATDFDGNFTLNASQGQTLVVSYIGYITKEIKIGAQSHYNITLEEDKKVLDEVVVVGYGTMKKSDLAGATGSMDEKKMKGSIITNLDHRWRSIGHTCDWWHTTLTTNFINRQDTTLHKFNITLDRHSRIFSLFAYISEFQVRIA